MDSLKLTERDTWNLVYFTVGKFYLKKKKKSKHVNSLVVQWLGFCLLTAYGVGSVPDLGTKIPQAVRSGPKKPPL